MLKNPQKGEGEEPKSLMSNTSLQKLKNLAFLEH